MNAHELDLERGGSNQKTKWWSKLWKREIQRKSSVPDAEERKRAYGVLLARLQQQHQARIDNPVLPVQNPVAASPVQTMTMLDRVGRALLKAIKSLRDNCLCACFASVVANIVATLFFFLMQWLAKKFKWSFFHQA